MIHLFDECVFVIVIVTDERRVPIMLLVFQASAHLINVFHGEWNKKQEYHIAHYHSS